MTAQNVIASNFDFTDLDTSSIFKGKFESKYEAMNLIQSDKRRLIVGLGATGKSCMRHFLRLGLPFSVLDTRSQPPGIQDIAREFPDVEICLGEQHSDLINTASELYISPGIALDDLIFNGLDSDTTFISGDIDLFAREAVAPVIAISGSNAKSTVTTLVGEMARQAGLNAGIGGNLGEPALNLLSPQRDCYVLELSSFQLERCSELRPKVACLLNISADHMDRHHTMMAYHQAKQRVYRGAEHIVFNRHDALTTPLLSAGVTVSSFGLDAPDLSQYGIREINGQKTICKGFDALLSVSELPLAGDHNLLNVLAALAIGAAAGFDMAVMFESIKSFKGLEHRCELLAQINGVTYVNDSKATNVGATVAAIRGFASSLTGQLILIAGGETKGADFSALLKELNVIDCKTILIGDGAAEITALIEAKRSGNSIEVLQASSLEHAVEIASENAQSGDLVLLSPACASFDMFKGFEHRGDVFKAAVMQLKNSTAQGGQQ